MFVVWSTLYRVVHVVRQYRTVLGSACRVPQEMVAEASVRRGYLWKACKETMRSTDKYIII